MWFTLLALLACSETPAAPEPPVAPHPVEPTEPVEPPVGHIGGEPILPTPTVIGAMSADDVNAGVGERMGDIGRCYAVQREKNPGLAGKVLIRFVIAKDGTVRSASTKSTSLRDEATETCVIEQVLKARFPPLPRGDTALVSYPFVFPPP